MASCGIDDSALGSRSGAGREPRLNQDVDYAAGQEIAQIEGAPQTPRCYREVGQPGTASGLAQVGAVHGRPEDRRQIREDSPGLRSIADPARRIFLQPQVSTRSPNGSEILEEFDLAVGLAGDTE
jgi:hypothetical protein